MNTAPAGDSEDDIYTYRYLSTVAILAEAVHGHAVPVVAYELAGVGVGGAGGGPGLGAVDVAVVVVLAAPRAGGRAVAQARVQTGALTRHTSHNVTRDM